MAWCRQATSHYLHQCWPRSTSPYGVISPQWVNSLWLCDAIWRHRSGSTLAQVMAWRCQAPSHYLNRYSGVQQNDWETHPPPENYSTASDTWIEASTNKMPSRDYEWSRSNTCHCDVMSQILLWSWWRSHKFVVSESPVHFFPHQLLDAVGLK